MGMVWAQVMARIANATYDVTQSPLVMAMLWKRLNDMGKHWRHCYKVCSTRVLQSHRVHALIPVCTQGLLLLDYLLKTGADHIVAEVCRTLHVNKRVLRWKAQVKRKGLADLARSRYLRSRKTHLRSSLWQSFSMSTGEEWTKGSMSVSKQS